MVMPRELEVQRVRPRAAVAGDAARERAVAPAGALTAALGQLEGGDEGEREREGRRVEGRAAAAERRVQQAGGGEAWKAQLRRVRREQAARARRGGAGGRGAQQRGAHAPLADGATDRVPQEHEESGLRQPLAQPQ